MRKNKSVESIAREIESIVGRLVAEVRSRVKQEVATRKPAKAGKTKKLCKLVVVAGSKRPKAVEKKRMARRGPPRGTPVAEKPCPVCGLLNKARRYSYRCPAHRAPAGAP